MTAPIGHNNPPEPTPFEIAETKVGDLYGEAKLWLDGEPVASQEHADGIARLLDEARKAEKAADAARKAEKEPHLAASRAVDALYKPVLDDAQRMQAGLKAALTPWLERLEAEKREAERQARAEADRLRREAEEAARAADRANLQEQEQAEAALKAAKQAEAAASRSERERGQAKGFGMARAVSLRTYYEPELTDTDEAVRHYWSTRKDAFVDLVQRLAAEDVRAGKRQVPGFRVIERKIAA